MYEGNFDLFGRYITHRARALSERHISFYFRSSHPNNIYLKSDDVSRDANLLFRTVLVEELGISIAFYPRIRRVNNVVVADNPLGIGRTNLPKPASYYISSSGDV